MRGLEKKRMKRDIQTHRQTDIATVGYWQLCLHLALCQYTNIVYRLLRECEMIGWVCLQLCTVQCAVHCVQCTALQCSVVHYSVVYLCVQWSALQCGTLWCSAVQCDYKYQKGSQPIHQLQVLQETVEYIHCTHFSAVLTLYPNDNTLVPTPQCCNFTKVVIPMITCSYQIPSSVISEQFWFQFWNIHI